MTLIRDETRPQRRGPRVLPVLAVLALVVAVGAASSPGLRHQLAQSFSRQDAGYLELFFVDAQAAQSCASDEDGRMRVEVGVHSHFDTARSLAWTVAVSPTRGAVRAPASAQRGRVDVRPDHTTVFTAEVNAPASAAGTPSPYAVSVTLPGHSERLLLHC